MKKLIIASIISLVPLISFAENIDELIAKSKEEAAFADKYYSHMQELDSRKSSNAKFSGRINFVEYPFNQACNGAAFGIGGNYGGGYYGAYGNGNQYNNRVGCDCQPGSKKVSCIKGSSFSVDLDKRDTGGVAYFTFYVEKNDNFYLYDLKKGWQTYEQNYIDPHTFKVMNPGDRFDFSLSKGQLAGVCRFTGAGPVQYRIQYGNAKEIEFDFAKRIKPTQKDFNEDEHYYQTSNLSQWLQNKNGYVATAVCD